MYLGKIFQAVVYQPIIKKNDYSFLYKYLHDVPHLCLLTFYWHMVQVPLNTNQRPRNRCYLLLRLFTMR